MSSGGFVHAAVKPYLDDWSSRPAVHPCIQCCGVSVLKSAGFVSAVED